MLGIRSHELGNGPHVFGIGNGLLVYSKVMGRIY